MTRYVVATVQGLRNATRGGTSHRVGLSASVHDRLYAYRTVDVFRSEDPKRGSYGRIGADGAIAAAQALADRLNRGAA